MSDRKMTSIDKPGARFRSDGLATFWTATPEAVCAKLHCGLLSLSSSDAEQRLTQ
jgi:hypothetical protein